MSNLQVMEREMFDEDKPKSRMFDHAKSSELGDPKWCAMAIARDRLLQETFGLPNALAVSELNKKAMAAGIDLFDLWGSRPDELEYMFGSCQYATIADVVYSRHNLRHLDFQGWCKAFGVTVPLGTLMTVEEFRSIKLQDLEEFLRDEHLEEEDEDDRAGIEGTYKEAQEAIKSATTLTKIIEVMMKFTADSASDFWSAYGDADCRSNSNELKIKAKESPAYGPILNVMAQSENYEIGLTLVALMEHGVITVEQMAGDDWRWST